MTVPSLLSCLREAEARVLRRLMKVRVAGPVFAGNPKQWLETQFDMEIAQIALDYGISDMRTRFEPDGKTGGFFIHASGLGEARIYGPVLWHVAHDERWDVLSRRGVGYVLRHTDLL